MTHGTSVSNQIDSRKIWDTDDYRPSDRYAFFREGLCQSFLACTPEGVDPAVLKARIRRAELPASVLSTTFITPHRIVRSAQDAAKIPGEFLLLGHHLRGALSVGMGHQTVEQECGSVFLLAANDINTVDVISPHRFLSSALFFNRQTIEKDVRGLDRHRFVHGPYKQLIGQCLGLLCQRFETAPLSVLGKLSDAAQTLLVAHLLSDPDYLEAELQSGKSDGLVDVIKCAILVQLRDAALSGDKLARDMGISTRYLNKLFQARGTTLGRTLRDLRLDAVRKDLVKAENAHLPPFEIALRHGFRHQVTFYRNFKSRFDETPTEMRARLAQKHPSDQGSGDPTS